MADFLDENWTKVWTTEYSLISVWLFGQEYIEACRQEVGIGFHAIIFLVEGELATVFRLDSEQQAFAQRMAKMILTESDFRDKAERILSESKKEFKQLFEISPQEVLTPENISRFFQVHRQYLPYYIGVLWAPNALESFEISQSTREEIFAWCERIRKWTEADYPAIEKFLQRLFVFIADKEQRDVQLLRALLPEELVLYSCEGVLPSDDILKERYGYTVVLATEEGNKLLMKNDGAELIRKITTLDTSKINNITGEIGYKGNVRGRVRRVFTTKEGQIFEFGEILVTTMTRPEWLPLMKSAAGYITDGGGILCHAAIIARELKKPCIIGTKIATQVLRDGDLVEVDADNGVVRVLERAEEKGM